MKNIIISTLLIVLINITISDPDLTTYYKTFVENNGYQLEDHLVKTEDGYILNIWHIAPKNPSSKVVFLQHGLADTAWCFFQLGSNSLPFLLLKEGYDLWFGNNRGTIFSLKHESKDPYDEKSSFFDYTMDDYVKYDLPTSISYVKSQTGVEKVSYIGHSQGTTTFFMLYMHNPQFVESSIDHSISLATVPNLAYANVPVIKLLDIFYTLLKKINAGQGIGILGLKDATRLKISKFCLQFSSFCQSLFESGTTLKPSGIVDYTQLYNYLYYYPGGTNNKNLLQWDQIKALKQLVYYNPNYDQEKTATPYNTDVFKQWKVKTLVTRTDNDPVSAYQDLTDLKNSINNDSILTVLDIPNYGHIDVLAGQSAIKDIYDKIIEFLKE